MELNRLLEITNDLERCAICPDKDYGCEHCDVDPDTQEELREYYQQVRETLSEHDALKAETAKWRSKLKTMQEEYLETCFGECESCRFYVEPNADDSNMPIPAATILLPWTMVEPNADDSNMPTEGYCSIRSELKEE